MPEKNTARGWKRSSASCVELAALTRLMPVRKNTQRRPPISAVSKPMPLTVVFSTAAPAGTIIFSTAASSSGNDAITSTQGDGAAGASFARAPGRQVRARPMGRRSRFRMAGRMPGRRWLVNVPAGKKLQANQSSSGACKPGTLSQASVSPTAWRRFCW